MVILDKAEDINKAIEENDMTLLYFGADSCSVCVDMKPKIVEMLKKYPEIKAFDIDAHASRKLSAEFNVFTVPVVAVYAEGKEVIREARHLSIFDLDERIGRYYNMLF